MGTSWDYDIERADDQCEMVHREMVQNVTREHVADGVLSLYRRGTSYGPKEIHLGSWPLVNVSRWQRVER